MVLQTGNQSVNVKIIYKLSQEAYLQILPTQEELLLKIYKNKGMQFANRNIYKTFNMRYVLLS